jgi:4-amino-4-deoxy-L-arabinose transferase-like glycosyltransferase
MLTLPWWLYTAAPSWGLLGAIISGITVPILLLITARLKTRNGPGITALCMIPFSVIGVMDVIANLDNPLQGLIVAVLSVTVFFAALDVGRRSALG